ncbi:NAD(P)/FAD-dependent oxidoreductase [Aequorivita marisscotiae]|uniref:NAD(P)/FAD-dependent oxidoreductase n=1 Tax=Aequorivita marisscotiae TaxID=3040348 RepID=A0ABY8KSI8_9FLAO|nr:NAD(P)/FAD-dependent oxidoreductase [Aequorivita sp. Ant34-E75]WGF91993.1 NAD(P)/FAD-dependent oxidoreductase [Aequorivita sp. Ant34-E75]
MAKMNKWDVIIIGGGLAGLTTALHLANNNCAVCLIEKNEYPNHKVCGEYVSNEILPYLKTLGVNPFSVGAKKISQFKITEVDGNSIAASLPLGGFGISRYTFDDLLYSAIKSKVQVLLDTVETVNFKENHFKITTKTKQILTADFVVGAYGKRSNLDSFLNRKFMRQSSPWLAVKAHYNYDFPEDTVALHNFNGGYCGLSKTESNAVNACYLTTFKSFKKYKNIDDFQKLEMSKNPCLHNFFTRATPLFKKPLTISQIAFHKKNPVENHIFMVGDSAGLIHPLCGNGMAMAIKSAKIFSEIFLKYYRKNNFNRRDIEIAYAKCWKREFESRLTAGRTIQRILMNPVASKIGFAAAKALPQLLPLIIKKTHGKTIT